MPHIRGAEIITENGGKDDGIDIYCSGKEKRPRERRRSIFNLYFALLLKKAVFKKMHDGLFAERDYAGLILCQSTDDILKNYTAITTREFFETDHPRDCEPAEKIQKAIEKQEKYGAELEKRALLIDSEVQIESLRYLLG